MTSKAKKLIILNIPYVLFGLAATKLGAVPQFCFA